MAQEFRIPLERERVASRKERFFALNQFVTKRHGWLTSCFNGMPPGLIAAGRIEGARLSP